MTIHADSPGDPAFARPGGAEIAGVATDVAVLAGLVVSGLAVNLAQTASLLVAAGLVFAINVRRLGASLVPGGFSARRAVLPAALVALAALFLRGGILALLTERVGLGLVPAVAIAVLGAAVVTTVGGALLVYPGSAPPDTRRARIVVAVVGYVLLLKLVYLGRLELLHEEAYYWNYAQHLALSYLDHPPLVAWLIAAGTTLLGDTEPAVRLGAFASWFVGAWFVARLTRRIFDGPTARDAVLLYTVLPIYFVVSFVMLPDSWLMACWAASLYYLHAMLVEERPLAFLRLGFWFGLGLLSKYTILLLGPAALAFVIADRRARRWLLRPEPWLALAVAMLVFSPVLVWNAKNAWASFVYQGPTRASASFDFDLPDLLGSVLLLLTPTGFMTAIAITLSRRPFVGEATADAAEQRVRAYRLLLLLTAVPLSVFVAFSLFRNIKLNWTGPVWLGLIPLMARMMAPETQAVRPPLPLVGRTSWVVTVTILVMFYGGGFHLVAQPWPGVPLPANVLGTGWSDLARQVEAVVEEIETSTGERPLVVGMDPDQVNSWLAFYRGHHGRHGTDAGAFDTTSCHLFEGEGRAYEFWMPAAEAAGRTLVLVDRDPEELTQRRVEKRIRRGGDVRELVAERNGRVAARVYYRVVEGYRVK